MPIASDEPSSRLYTRHLWAALPCRWHWQLVLLLMVTTHWSSLPTVQPVCASTNNTFARDTRWGSGQPMTKARVMRLREEVRDMFHHGWDNYMLYAFPQDEIKPLSCLPNRRTRPPEPLNLGLNDALGNFSLTAIDTLSTLGILAESSHADKMRFWRAVEELRVRFYPNEGFPNHSEDFPTKRRRRSKGHGRGFDIDSRVQVFETTIRILGGLLSAHLYATGEFGQTVFPIPQTLELTPEEKLSGLWGWFGNSGSGVRTQGSYYYDGHLLDLAYDLAERMLPAFQESVVGVPFPRVNLRHGMQFARGRNLKQRKRFQYEYEWEGKYFVDSPFYAPDEETEEQTPTVEEPDSSVSTCPAGAGSLVLEFTVLSRLTGDGRFEEVAKRAFDSVWRMRSTIGLLGMELELELDKVGAQWAQHYSGIGAGIDSLFEYAFKAYILLSGSPTPQFRHSPHLRPSPHLPPPFSPEYFLSVWSSSHSSISRHLLQKYPTPHYLNVHMSTGATILNWVDSLSAFYPGLLTLAGHLSEAESSHLFYTALWARYHALPERWNVHLHIVDSGLGWWPGRPEFIESTYFLHQATKDEWYLRVGEMVLRDIQQRCFGVCGWVGLDNVETGIPADRMESFMLGETLQYLFLLFDGEVRDQEGLAKNDGDWVFTTEGHPLLIPKSTYSLYTQPPMKKEASPLPSSAYSKPKPQPTCEVPRPLTLMGQLGNSSLTISTHPNLFHAFVFTHTFPIPSILIPSSHSLSLTLPTCAPIPNPYLYAFELVLPPLKPPPSTSTTPPTSPIHKPPHNFYRVPEGLFVYDLASLRLSLIVDPDRQVRIFKVNSVNLGRDEVVYFPRSLLEWLLQDGDDNLRLVEEEGGGIDFAVEYPSDKSVIHTSGGHDEMTSGAETVDLGQEHQVSVGVISQLEHGEQASSSGGSPVGASVKNFWKETASEVLGQVKYLHEGVGRLFNAEVNTAVKVKAEEIPSIASSPPSQSQAKISQSPTVLEQHRRPTRRSRLKIYPGLVAAGPGSHSLPYLPQNPLGLSQTSSAAPAKPTYPPAPPPIRLHKIHLPTYLSSSLNMPNDPAYACHSPLTTIPTGTEILFILRGHCEFSEKLRNVPDIPSLKLVVFIDIVSDEGREPLVRPFLEKEQVRRNKVGAIMVGGGKHLFRKLSAAVQMDEGIRVGLDRKWEVLVKIPEELDGKDSGRRGRGTETVFRRIENLAVLRG